MNTSAKRAKFIFVTGGVVSGLGKGITAASMGRLLKERGFKVTAQKFDPYINVDPGMMSPLQHGEVFVTDDGAETDLDLGHYERFIDENLNKYSSVSTGKVYTKVLSNERKGYYLGSTIQVIPHITNEIKRRMFRLAETTDADIVISEIGGTVGDIESLPYLESIRQVGREIGRDNVLYIHVTLVPYLEFSGEHKSKPTQHSVKELLSHGIQPDIIICRADKPMGTDLMEKIAMFCGVPTDCVIENLTMPILYQAPLMLEQANFSDIICRELKLQAKRPKLTEWQHLVNRIKNLKRTINIALVGKYVQLHDAYISVTEALYHGGYENQVNVNIEWIDSEELESLDTADALKDADGIIVPGGFGRRGTAGMMKAIKYARENDIPFLGIAFGMQMAIIEYARNVLHIKDATSVEFDKDSPHKVIDFRHNQEVANGERAPMRLGKYPCTLLENTLISQVYQSKEIEERHRHRYEINYNFANKLQKKGMIVSGISSTDCHLSEAIEIVEHRWFIGVLFHPEFKSRPNRAHPLFRDFISASNQTAQTKESPKKSTNK